tara:strand:- start:352 stop:717 length:366 start_codon:yes stop_codon:yes gene_type:complete
MGFRRKKIYGQSKTSNCPFCQKLATTKNEQGIEVCYQHIKEVLPEIKCTCGSWLECRVGKFGPYFNCLNCGNINYNKAMEIKFITMKNKSFSVLNKETKPKKTISRSKEITITSDDVEYFS